MKVVKYIWHSSEKTFFRPLLERASGKTLRKSSVFDGRHYVPHLMPPIASGLLHFQASLQHVRCPDSNHVSSNADVKGIAVCVADPCPPTMIRPPSPPVARDATGGHASYEVDTLPLRIEGTSALDAHLTRRYFSRVLGEIIGTSSLSSNFAARIS
jgi:hypothetical protein